MEVSESPVGHLTNFEVLDLLSERREEALNNPNPLFPRVQTETERSVREFLVKSTPIWKMEDVQEFLAAISHLKLTNLEKIQLLNMRPTSHVDVNVVIRNVSEETSREIIDLVKKYLCEKSTFSISEEMVQDMPQEEDENEEKSIPSAPSLDIGLVAVPSTVFVVEDNGYASGEEGDDDS